MIEILTMFLIPFTPATDKYKVIASLPAPHWKEVLQFCKDNGVDAAWLRPSKRSFTGWVAVACYNIADIDAEAAEKTGRILATGASEEFFEGAYCAVKVTTIDVRVSIPCIPFDIRAFRIEI